MASPDPEPFAAARFAISAVIKDAVTGVPVVSFGAGYFGDIISVSATFALNTIPTASLVLGIGYNSVTGKPATIHDVRDKIQARDSISVFLEVIPADAGDKTKIRAATYKIFEGFVVGIGYQRSHTHANYVLNLVHWLDDLNNSTALNGDWLPGAPADYASAALTTTLNSGATTVLGAVPAFEFPSVARSASEDLWAKVITPACQKLAGYSPRTNLLGTAENNSAALAALARMPGAAGAGGKYYRPLELRVPPDTTNMDKSLNEYFTKVFSDPSAQNSFWAKIVTELAPDFLFAISPAVDWALPIPVCSGLRWQPGGKVIAATDYNYASFNANMSQIIEAVHIIYPLGSSMNTSSEATKANAAQPNSYMRLYASYPPPEVISDNKQKRGLKLFKQPPPWLNGLDASALMALYSSQTLVLTAGASPPTAAALPGLVNTTIDAVEKAKSVVADFAQQMYCNEVLQQRVGELSGALRFDIAPGSIVKIMTPLRDAATNDDHVIASVMAVSYVINAERATAGTSFTVAHTKTPAESVNEFYSVPRPPLYGTTPAYKPFYNGPLAEPI